MVHVDMHQSSSLEALSSKEISSPFSRTLCSSSDTRQPDDIERRLTLAASCIQEALILHRRDATGTTIDKNSTSTPNLFKGPSVSSNKMKSTKSNSKGECPESGSKKLTNPRLLTPYPGRKTKSSFTEKPSITRASTPFNRGRTPSSSTSGRGQTLPGSNIYGRGRTPSQSTTSVRGHASLQSTASGKRLTSSRSATSCREQKTSETSTTTETK
jgi:hypothetical protein